MDAAPLYSVRPTPLDRYDVVVAGGGPAGMTAALGAARRGMKVLLVERMSQIGGMGTSGLVSHWLGGRTGDSKRWVVGGLFKRFSEETARMGVSVIPSAEPYADVPYAPYGEYKGLIHGIPFDPFAMASYLEQELRAAGVDLLLQVQVLDVVMSERRITGLILAGKEGTMLVEAEVFVDATGDGDLAAMSGCRFVKGDEHAGGFMCAISVIFHIENVDEERLMRYVIEEDDPRFRKILAHMQEQGEDTFNYLITIFVKLNQNGTFMVNGRAVSDVDGTNSRSRTEALCHDRARIQKTMQLFRKYYPGLENARIKAVASDLGVRETRRIEGEYRVTVEDVQNGASYPDTIGLTAYGWDLSSKDKVQPMHGKKKPPVVPIPYRIMVPKDSPNLICPGRSVCVERHVLGPMRVMAPIMAMGEAAGQAAAQTVERGIPFKNVDTDRLRDELQEQGAILDLDATVPCEAVIGL